MELMFAALGGAILGLAARYFLPRHENHGVVLVPMIGTVVASVVWVGLTWLGWKWDGGWIWWASLGAAALVSAGVSFWLGRRREAADERLLAELGGSALAA